MFGWTAASDFWQSKTTHLALATVSGAVTTILTHRAPVLPTVAIALLTVAIAFLRDTHAKSAEMIVDFLGDLIDAVQHYEADGEADALVPVVPPLAPITAGTGVTIFPPGTPTITPSITTLPGGSL